MLIDDLKRDLIRHEGVILHAYEDSEGFLTIGCGRLIDPRRGGGISRSEAEMLLKNDLLRVCTGVFERLPWVHSQPYQIKRAIFNMAFQLGITGLLRFKKFLAALEVGNYDEAILHAYKSKWAKQTPARVQWVVKLIKEVRDGSK